MDLPVDLSDTPNDDSDGWLFGTIDEYNAAPPVNVAVICNERRRREIKPDFRYAPWRRVIDWSLFLHTPVFYYARGRGVPSILNSHNAVHRSRNIDRDERL